MKRVKKELLRKIHGAQTAQILYTATALGIPDFLGAKSHTLQDIASCLKLDQELLERLLFALISLGLLAKDGEGYQLTDEGMLLHSESDESMKDLVLYKLSPFIWRAYEKFAEGFRSNQSPFSLAHGSQLFDYLETHPEDMKTFQNAMSYYEKSASKQILEHLPELDKCSVIDIGGGQGGFIASIKQLKPNWDVANFDLPSVIKPLYHDDILHIGGNFFEEVPVGYDLYLLRNILHDWSDEAAVSILQTIKAAMSPHAKLVLLETILPEGNQRLGRFADLTMFALTPGGKERKLNAFEKLLEATGFKIVSHHSNSSSKSLLLAEPQ